MDLLGNGQEVVVRLFPLPRAGYASRPAATRGGGGGSGGAVFGARARPVGAAENGVEVRGEEEVERPAAGGIDGFAIVLVDGVEVWAFFAVDEDGDEGFVEEGCDRGV